MGSETEGGQGGYDWEKLRRNEEEYNNRISRAVMARDKQWLEALGADRTDFSGGLTSEDLKEAARQLVRSVQTPALTGDVEIDGMLRDCINTMATKGAEYTVGSPDRLANFRGAASDVGIKMEQCWYVFFNKHLRAVQAYIKNGCYVKSNEPIQSRVMDCIVYLFLFHKMTLDIERSRIIVPPREK